MWKETHEGPSQAVRLGAGAPGAGSGRRLLGLKGAPNWLLKPRGGPVATVAARTENRGRRSQLEGGWLVGTGAGGKGGVGWGGASTCICRRHRRLAGGLVEGGQSTQPGQGCDL